MAVETGLNWKIAVDTAESTSTPTWVELPQQRGGGVTLSKEFLDATNKDQTGWMHSIANRRGISFTVDGLSDDNDLALQYLVDTNHFHATAVDKGVHLRLTNAVSDTIIAWFSMDSFEMDIAEDALVSYTASFTSRAQDNAGAASVPAITRA